MGKKIVRYLALLSLISVFLGSCAKKSRDVVSPADESTPEERSKIELTLEKIESLARNHGYSGNFRSIPVHVTAEDPKSTNRWGYCILEGEEGRYIVLNRKVFEAERDEPIFRSVFAVLLHEIGHCYLGRMHEHIAVPAPADHKIEITSWSSGRGISFYLDEFPISIMYTRGEAEGGPLSNTFEELEDYFTAELLRKSRVLNIQEVERLPGIKLRKIN